MDFLPGRSVSTDMLGLTLSRVRPPCAALTAAGPAAIHRAVAQDHFKSLLLRDMDQRRADQT